MEVNRPLEGHCLQGQDQAGKDHYQPHGVFSSPNTLVHTALCSLLLPLNISGFESVLW